MSRPLSKSTTTGCLNNQDVTGVYIYFIASVYFLDVTGGIQAKLKEFEFLRPLLAKTEIKKLDELERLYRTKLEIDAHYTLQQPLRWWLYFHLPVSLVLFVLLALHLYTVFVY